MRELPSNLLRQCLSIAHHSSQQSITKVVSFAVKFFPPCGEDLWDCIVEETQKVPGSSRARIIGSFLSGLHQLPNKHHIFPRLTMRDMSFGQNSCECSRELPKSIEQHVRRSCRARSTKNSTECRPSWARRFPEFGQHQTGMAIPF